MASLWKPPISYTSFKPIRFPFLNPTKMAFNLNHNLQRTSSNGDGFNESKIFSSSSSSSSLSLSTSQSSDTADKSTRKLPVLLFDIMDTIVRDPFYQDVPAFFRMSMEELIELKHPTVWIEFEKGLIDEAELVRRFFKDGRPFDFEGLKKCMINGYSYLEGIEELLNALKERNYEMHAFTNYPVWYEMVEEKLKISRYLSWTFCSCTNGKRKPDPEFYLEALRHLEVEPASCIFVDDRMKNVEAAKEVGIVGLHFKSADLLLQDLCLLGIDISADKHDGKSGST